MKHMTFFYSSVLLIVLAIFSAQSAGEDSRRVWQTSVCYQLRLSVGDKLSQGRYSAKYIVTSSDGRVFIAENKTATDSNTAEVIFPNNFREENTNLKAWVNCRYGENYSWDIYANGELIDSGSIVFSKKKQK